MQCLVCASAARELHRISRVTGSMTKTGSGPDALDEIERSMSANVTSRTSHLHRRMSAIGGKADMKRTGRYVG